MTLAKVSKAFYFFEIFSGDILAASLRVT